MTHCVSRSITSPAAAASPERGAWRGARGSTRNCDRHQSENSNGRSSVLMRQLVGEMGAALEEYRQKASTRADAITVERLTQDAPP